MGRIVSSATFNQNEGSCINEPSSDISIIQCYNECLQLCESSNLSLKVIDNKLVVYKESRELYKFDKIHNLYFYLKGRFER